MINSNQIISILIQVRILNELRLLSCFLPFHRMYR